MKSQKNIWWWGFLVGKVMIPALLLISLPMITFFFTNKKMSKEAVIFFFGDQKATFIETLVTSLQLNLNYIFSIIIVISLLNFLKKEIQERCLTLMEMCTTTIFILYFG